MVAEVGDVARGEVECGGEGGKAQGLLFGGGEACGDEQGTVVGEGDVAPVEEGIRAVMSLCQTESPVAKST